MAIAGPNGSGKSTLIAYLQKNEIDFGTCINADDIAKDQGLVGDAGSARAQQIADEKRAECLKTGQSFSFETVMSHESKVEFMHKARAAGFKVQPFFDATGDPDININRVKGRVAAGGHDVPVDRIVKRYWRTLGLMTGAILASDSSVIFDNSISEESTNSPAMLRPILATQTIFDGATANTVSLQFVMPFTKWCLDALAFAEQGFATSGHKYENTNLIVNMSRVSGNRLSEIAAILGPDALTEAEQQLVYGKNKTHRSELDAKWRQTITELLQVPEL
jgi:predicted ABC-type ATPase